MRVLLLLPLALAAAVLSVSATKYVYPRAISHRRPVRYLIQRSANPRIAFSFIEAQLCQPLMRQLLRSRYPRPTPELLRQLTSSRRQLPPVKQLQTLLNGLYRQRVGPIYDGLLPYVMYTRAGRLFSRKSLLNPLTRLSASKIQLQFLKFLTRIDPRLMKENIGDNIFSEVRGSLAGINRSYRRLSVPVLRNLYNTFVSVIGGNGRSQFLLGLSQRQRLQHFSTSLGLYLGQNRNQLPTLLKNNALMYQDFAGDIDGQYILHSSGIRLLGQLQQQQQSEADRFFHQLEHDHFEAVSDVLSSIFRVQRSISWKSLPHLGYSGLLARRFYPGLDVGQTDIIARYILSALSGYGAVSRSAFVKTGGLVNSLQYLPYVRGLPSNTVSTIQQADLARILGGLNLPGLSPRLTPGILQAARRSQFITQVMLAALMHGVRFTTPQQSTLLFRDVFASLLMQEKNFNAARFTSFLGDRLRPFALMCRVTIPNMRPAIRRIPDIRMLPLSGIISLQDALRRGLIQLPAGLARRVGIIVRPRRHVIPVQPPAPTEPPFPSIVVSRITLRSVVARRVYVLLHGSIPILTVEMLQPVLQLLVEREVVPVVLLRSPDKLVVRLQQVLKAVRPLLVMATKAAMVPSFVTDKAFTSDIARVAFILDILVIYAHGYTELQPPLVTNSVQAILRAYYGANKAFQPVPYLQYSNQYFPQLVARGLLARPLRLGSMTLPALTVTNTLSGLRPVYGRVTYHGLGSVLSYPGAAPLLAGIKGTDSAALIRALTFGATKPVFQLSQGDVSGLQDILKPLTLFDKKYSVQDLQFLFAFGVRDLRIPRSIYSSRITSLFRESLVSFIGTKKPLITNRIYNPAYLNLVINDFLVDKLTSGYLSPRVQVRVPAGQSVTLRRAQLTSLMRQSLQPLRLRMLPSYLGQLLTLAIPEVRVLRTVKPTSLLPSFGRYLGSGPFRNFRFSLTDNEFSGILGQLRSQRYLPGFFLRYPPRLQRYYFDNLFGSFAAYSLVRQSSEQFSGGALRHSVVYNSFSRSLIPSFFRSRKFTNLGDLFGGAPDYFSLCRRTFRTLPGLQIIRHPSNVGGIHHVVNGRMVGSYKAAKASGFFSK
uniref:Larval cement protein band 1-122k n=1 Tax=Megabalanus rosa TaxID=6680 RepID=A0A5B9RIM0_MEGRO|nr:larval cement protein band 1-122k [Megabalanus rosa]